MKTLIFLALLSSYAFAVPDIAIPAAHVRVQSSSVGQLPSTQDMLASGRKMLYVVPAGSTFVRLIGLEVVPAEFPGISVFGTSFHDVDAVS